jgi:CheY-like chemotaxis protein
MMKRQKRIGQVCALVVDARKREFHILSAILSGYSLKIHRHARTAEEVLKLCKSEPFDLIVLDTSIDEAAGADFVRRIRTQAASANKTVPIVLMAAQPNRLLVEMARDAGVTEFCATPAKNSVLLNKISEAVINPRPFVSSPDYSGPDRRRKQPTAKTNLGRRQSDCMDPRVAPQLTLSLCAS